MKLKICDIKIKTPREQLYALINTKFKKIDDFAAAILCDPLDVKKYLGKPHTAPEEFKMQVSQVFGKEYNKIILPADEQISCWVGEVTDNISQYKEPSDFDTLEALKNLCIEKDKKIEIGKMHRNIGMFYYYTNMHETAVEMMLIAIDLLSGENVFDLALKYKSDLCLLYYHNRDFKKAQDLFENIESMIDEFESVDPKTAFLHNYRWGIFYNNTKRTTLARSKFEKAIIYAKSKHDAGNATMNIGLSYIKDKQFDAALEYYQEALKIYDPEDYINRSIVYNNMADLYRLNGEPNKALEHIVTALKILDDRDQSKLFLYSITYIQIKIMLGKDNDSLAILFDLLMITKTLYLFRRYANEAINIILKNAEAKNDTKIMSSLVDALISMIKNAIYMKYDDEYLQELRACLGNIHLSLQKYEHPNSPPYPGNTTL